MSEKAVRLSSKHPSRPPRAPPGSPSTEAARASSTSRRATGGEVARDLALDQQAELEDLPDVRFGRLEHAGSPVWLDLDEPVALEAYQRLAHGGLRDAELCRDARLDELLRRARASRR